MCTPDHLYDNKLEYPKYFYHKAILTGRWQFLNFFAKQFIGKIQDCEG